jgi:hypothetical protein
MESMIFVSRQELATASLYDGTDGEVHAGRVVITLRVMKRHATLRGAGFHPA